MGLQHDHVSRVSLQQLKPELAVSLTAEGLECSSTEVKCSVRGALCPQWQVQLLCSMVSSLPLTVLTLQTALILQLQQVGSVHTFWMETLSCASYVSINNEPERERSTKVIATMHHSLQVSMAYTCGTSCKPLLGQGPTPHS